MDNKLKILWYYLKNFFLFILSPSPKWKDIDGYEGIYQISNEGNVYNVKEMKSVSTFMKNDGYMCVALTNHDGKVKQHRVHRLVATTFIPNVENKTIVKHKDGNKTNNHVKNIQWK